MFHPRAYSAHLKPIGSAPLNKNTVKMQVAYKSLHHRVIL